MTTIPKVGDLVITDDKSGIGSWLIKSNPDFESKGVKVTEIFEGTTVVKAEGYPSHIDISYLKLLPNPFETTPIEIAIGNRKVDFVL